MISEVLTATTFLKVEPSTPLVANPKAFRETDLETHFVRYCIEPATAALGEIGAYYHQQHYITDGRIDILISMEGNNQRLEGYQKGPSVN